MRHFICHSNEPSNNGQYPKWAKQVYAAEYIKVNNRINELSEALAAEIKNRGFRSKPIAASNRTDTIKIKGDFPHKTAATRAGLGWVSDGKLINHLGESIVLSKLLEGTYSQQ